MLFYSATGAKRPQGFLPVQRCAALPPRQQKNTLSPDAPRRKWRKLCLAKYKEADLMKSMAARLRASFNTRGHMFRAISFEIYQFRFDAISFSHVYRGR